MPEEKKDSKEEEKKTPEQISQSEEEKKDSPEKKEEEKTSQKKEDEEEEKVSISKKKLETLQKKSTDFDGIIEKQRLKKLASREEKKPFEEEKKEEGKKTQEELIEEARTAGKEAAQTEIRQGNIKIYEENLSSAYKDLLKDHKWLDDDEKITAIGKNFDPGVSISKEAILAKLKRAVQDTYPDQYEKFEKDRIRGEIMAEGKDIKVGSGGTGGGSDNGPSEDDELQYTKEDKRIADKYFKGNMKRYLKTKKED